MDKAKAKLKASGDKYRKVVGLLMHAEAKLHAIKGAVMEASSFYFEAEGEITFGSDDADSGRLFALCDAVETAITRVSGWKHGAATQLRDITQQIRAINEAARTAATPVQEPPAASKRKRGGAK